MSKQRSEILRLQRIAQMRSDLEMRRFSAFRQHVDAAKVRISGCEAALQAIFTSDAEFSIEEARLANALAGERSRALVKAEADLKQIMPGFQTARLAAVKEFGRVQTLKSLEANIKADDSKRVERKLRDDF